MTRNERLSSASTSIKRERTRMSKKYSHDIIFLLSSMASLRLMGSGAKMRLSNEQHRRHMYPKRHKGRRESGGIDRFSFFLRHSEGFLPSYSRCVVSLRPSYHLEAVECSCSHRQ
ncbi:hypothetical protein Trydic_g22112 [Trypoxylus dichotomus]